MAPSANSWFTYCSATAMALSIVAAQWLWVTEPFAIVAQDLNHDGKTDLSVANLASNSLSVLLGNGNGTFQPAVSYAAGSGPVAIRASHLTRDGNLDLVACADVSNAVLVFKG